MKKLKNIMTLDVPDETKAKLKAISVALGTTQQWVYRKAFEEYTLIHIDLIEQGERIMRQQKALRKG